MAAGGPEARRDERTPNGVPEPTLDSESRAVELFALARDLPGPELDAFLSAQCGDDAPLRAEVMALLGRASSTPADVVASRAVLEAGTILSSRYRVVSHIGTGGVGLVYRADQLHPVARPVAIKVLSGGLAGASIARFEAERDALSRLSHPHIASILDVGQTADDKLFVVMELVEGVPIDEYCDRYQLDLDQRIALFAKVCRGIHHAHQRGIIHRDLKPTNILVAHNDGEGIPKIIDFGIAVVSEGGPSGAEPRAAGAHKQLRFVGTPDYASPEQAGAIEGDITTASDVYSLGIVLFKLLTGDVPLRQKGALSDWQQALSTRPLPRPSTFVGNAGEGTLTTSPRIPKGALRGDLDAIVMKATARERERRYSSVSELAMDLELYRHHRPVVARPGTLPYVLSRFVRRHWFGSLAVALMSLGLVVAVVVVVGLSASREREHARAEVAAGQIVAERALAAEHEAQAELMTARSHLAAAAAALEVRDAALVRKNLAAIAEQFRGWEWKWLEAEADRSLESVAAHTTGITALSMSGDGRRMASASRGGELALWDLRDAGGAKLIGRVQAHARALRGLALSADGALAFTSDAATRLVAWDVATRREVWHLDGAYALHPAGLRLDGGELVVAGRDDDFLTFFEPETGKQTRVVPIAQQGDVERVVFGRDNRVAYATSSRTIVLDLAGGRPRTFTGRLTAIDPERRYAAVWAWNEWDRRRVLDLATGKEIGQVERAGGTNDLAFGPNLSVAITDFDHGVGFQADLTKSRTWVTGHEGPVDAVVFTPDGKSVWAGDATGTLKRWPMGLTPAPFAVGQTNDAALGAAMAPGGHRIVTVGWGTVKLWDADRGAELWTRWISRKYLTAVDIAPSGREVAVADWNGTFWRLAMDDGSPSTPKALAPGANITRLAWVGERAAIATTKSGEIMRFDPRDGRIEWSYEAHHETPVSRLAVSPDRRLFATSGATESTLPTFGQTISDRVPPDTTVKLWESESGVEPISLEPLHGPWTALAFSRDGHLLAGAADDGTLAIWKVGDGSFAARPTRAGERLTGLVFSADGRRLLVGRFGSVVVFEVASGTPLLTLSGPAANFQAMSLDDAGRLAIVGSVAPVVVFDPGDADVGLRAHTADVRALVDQRFEREAGMDAVVSGLEADASLDAVLRSEAVVQARARGDNPNALNSWAWAAVRFPGEHQSLVHLARARAELCADKWPRWEFENTRALARYRDGDAAGALLSAEHSMAMQKEGGATATPSDWAITALARASLGEREAAAEALARARSEAETSAWKSDTEVRALIEEARGVLEPVDQ